MITNFKKEQSTLSKIQLEKTMKLLSDKFCHRCGGLMISEHCFDIGSHTGEYEILIRKCLSCGETIDPTILKNRLHNQDESVEAITSDDSFYSPARSAEGSTQHP